MTDARLGRCGKLASATAAAVVLAALLALPCANATAAAAPFGWVGAVAVSPSTGRVLLGIGDNPGRCLWWSDDHGATWQPTGASFNTDTGEFTWAPQAVQIGEHDLRVAVSDGELSVSQPLRLIVSAAPLPPAIRLELTPSFPANIGQPVLVQAAASGIADIASISVSIDGQPQTLDQFGRVRGKRSKTDRHQFR